MIRFASAAAAAALIAYPVAAQAPAGASEGTITGTLNLDDVVWYVAGSADAPTSGWTGSETGREIRMVGVPREDMSGDPMDTLHVSFTAAGNPTEPVVRDAVVEYRRAGHDESWVAEGANVDLMVTALEVGESQMAIAGDLVARMTPGGEGEIVVDAEDLVTFDGNFQATLRRDGAGSSD